MYNAIIDAVLKPQVYQATKYVSPTYVITATRKRFKGKLQSARARQETLLLTIGKPNARARQFIASCERSGEPFPVKKIQLRTIR